jgi:peptide deformylase
MKELKLIPPSDPRVQTAIAPFTDDMLKEHDFKDLDGMMSRICQHEYDHILGRNFVEHVSKFKLKRAEEKAKKLIKQYSKA